MANLGNFNANDYENEYQPIPAGEYPAIITDSEMKDSQKGGQYLKLTVELIDGQYKGRKVFANLNLRNANPEAEKIAKISLGDICRAVGVLHPRESSELHGKPLAVKLSVRPETADFPASNDVKAWKPLAGNPPVEEKPINLPLVSPSTTSSKKPWER